MRMRFFAGPCVYTGLAATLLATGAQAADATGADTAPPKLQPVQVETQVNAPDPSPTPADYQRMQKGASEIVLIHVLSVTTIPAKTENNTPGALLVTAHATVTGVTHTATKLDIGSTINLTYGYVPAAAGVPAPPPVPVIKKGEDYRAYLTASRGGDTYSPVAGARSFVDPALPPESDALPEAITTPRAPGPLALPALLPTPINPAPAGVVRMRGQAMQSFVKLVQHNGQWAVSIAESDPVDLQVLPGQQPTLVAYYGPPIGTPVTQPAVVIYDAGTQPAAAPTKSNVTIERALVLNADHHALGDALWMQISDNSQIALPPAIWHWSETKVEVEDPVSHQVQTILYIEQPAAATGTAGTGK